MSTTSLTVFTELLVKEAAFGLIFVAIVLLLNSTLVLRIYLRFNAFCQKSKPARQFPLHIRFMVSMLLICLVELISILFWTGVIYAKGLVTNLTLALLFAGSCFTTLGIYSDILPEGWRFLALYICFSGLFSFAVATSALMGMITLIAKTLGEDKVD